jgi:hypothetical protein
MRYTVNMASDGMTLLIGGNYVVHRCNGLRWHDICIMFHNDRFTHVTLRLLSQQSESL